jgi:phosphoribosylanthranilate isomerase
VDLLGRIRGIGARVGLVSVQAAVAVTVDAGNVLLDEIVSAVAPDMLQLHGHESPARVAEIKVRYGLPVIKAFSISNAADLTVTKAYLGVADRFLFDARPPKGADLPGGNGVAFDWHLLEGFGDDYLLSGGLNAANVGDAVRIAHPPGLDISSGVERAPGVKDPALIEAFFQAVREARKKSAA